MASMAIDLFIIVAFIQYSFWAISRIYTYYVEVKHTRLKNPKYSLDDLDRIYKAKKERIVENYNSKHQHFCIII
jgi:hypothetical protein